MREAAVACSQFYGVDSTGEGLCPRIPVRKPAPAPSIMNVDIFGCRNRVQNLVSTLDNRMSVIAIDTHEVVKELVAAGFMDDQAKTLTRVVRRVQDVDMLNSAKKADLRETELRLDTKLQTSRAELVSWVFGATGFQTLLIVGAVIAITKIFGH